MKLRVQDDMLPLSGASATMCAEENGMNLVRRCTIALFSLSLAAPLVAQFADERVPRERTILLRDEVKREREEARKLGPLYITPQFGFSNLGYNNNVLATPEGEQIGDYTATAFAGARFLVPFGPKVFFRGLALPEYTWYRELDQLNRFGGEYRGTLLALFNRLSLQVEGGPQKHVRPLTTELERPVTSRTNSGLARVELDLFPRLGLFASAAQRTERYGSPEETFENADLLDRDDDAFRVGMRYHLRSFFDISAAVDRTRSDYKNDPRRDNETDAVLMTLYYDRPRTFVNATIGHREGKARNGGEFPGYSSVMGSYFISHELGAPITLEFFGDRTPANSLFLENPYYIQTRNGLGVSFGLGYRTRLRTFGELGSNRYPTAVLSNDQIVRRKDDSATVGAGFSFQLTRRLILTATASQTRFDSNIAGLDRSIFSVSTNLGFRGATSQ
jgi:hypothetical protein